MTDTIGEKKKTTTWKGNGGHSEGMHLTQLWHSKRGSLGEAKVKSNFPGEGQLIGQGSPYTPGFAREEGGTRKTEAWQRDGRKGRFGQKKKKSAA